MVYQERNTWATLIATVITVPIYIVIVLSRRMADRSPTWNGCRSCCGRWVRPSSARS